jgi:D-beta-D-heptose 7-phosphate kinase/D-beta-D-heptose 1-phosphate adenosyltransferase
MRTIFVNGCFDIIHRGHLELFTYAKSLGHKLIVGVDSDEKVRRDKGIDRPINCLLDRMFVLTSLRDIDEVLSFETRDGLIELVREIKPDVMVVGSDWEGEPIVGSEYARQVKYFNRIDAYSSTDIIDKIRKIL